MQQAQSRLSSAVWEAPPRPHTIGLALGGGAARGIAHVGVLQVLEEHGIYPDCIAGTSIGALVGGLYTAGVSATRLQQITNQVTWRTVSSLRLPAISLSAITLSNLSLAALGFPLGLLDLDKMIDWIDQLLGSAVRFDQLNLPFAAVATDLVSGATYVLNSGAIAPAIRASCSVPGIFTPARRNGRLLVDGGATNNLPVSIVREMGADYVIAVDLLPSSGAAIFSTQEPAALLREPANVVEVALNALYVLIRTTQTGGAPADCTICPKIGHISFTDLGASDPLLAAGRAATEAALPQLLADLGRSEQLEVGGWKSEVGGQKLEI